VHRFEQFRAKVVRLDINLDRKVPVAVVQNPPEGLAFVTYRQ
jgi:hypothetical protein